MYVIYQVIYICCVCIIKGNGLRKIAFKFKIELKIMYDALETLRMECNIYFVRKKDGSGGRGQDI
jgi:hypothetical protein